MKPQGDGTIGGFPAITVDGRLFFYLNTCATAPEGLQVGGHVGIAGTRRCL